MSQTIATIEQDRPPGTWYPLSARVKLGVLEQPMQSMHQPFALWPDIMSHVLAEMVEDLTFKMTTSGSQECVCLVQSPRVGPNGVPDEPSPGAPHPTRSRGHSTIIGFTVEDHTFGEKIVFFRLGGR
jgi:hypothetical protein